MRECPFTSCKNKVDGSNFCCPKHWNVLDPKYRHKAYQAYMEYLNKTISLEKLVEYQRNIVTEIEFGIQPEEQSGIKLGNRCQHCRCEILIAPMIGEGVSITLDPDHAGITGAYIIVGGYAYGGTTAADMRENASALALLRLHSCSGGTNGNARSAQKVARQRGRASSDLGNTS